MQLKNTFLLFIFSIGLTLIGNAQDILAIHGSVREKETTRKMEGVSIIISRDGAEFTTESTNSSGKFDFELPLGYRYNLKFTKQDYVYKIIQFDSKNIPAEDMEGGFDYPLEITLFPMIEGLDMSIFDQPIGKAKFDSEKNSIEFDHNYTAIMQQKIDDELDRLKNLELNKKQLQKDFDLLIERGDDKASKKKYQEAIEKYRAALKIFPDSDEAKQKIADAQANIDQLNKDKEFDAAYSKLIAEGNSLMKSQEWEKAKEKFEEALKMKPKEIEPKDRIREIEKLLDNLMNRDLFNDLVDQGDRKMQSQDYEKAIEKYQDALELIPTEKYPKNQIKEAQKLMKDLANQAKKQEALDKKYADKLALADENFANKNYTDARDLYVQAGKIKPEEQRPPQQIDAIDKLLAAQAEQAQKDKEREDALAKQRKLDELYQSILDDANKLYLASDLEEAKSKYELALTHKPNEQFPKTKIAEIDKRLQEIAENAKKEAKEQALNAENERIDREYQAIIDEALALLEEDKLVKSIAKFEASLKVKPMEKLPKSKIIYIQALIEAREKEKLENDNLAELERLRLEEEAEQARKDEEARLLLEEQQRLLAEQKRKQEEEDERKRKEKEEFEANKGSMVSEIDTSREREVERFYREAKVSSETAKGQKVQDKKDKRNNEIKHLEDAAQSRRKDNALGINNQQDKMEEVYRDGQDVRAANLRKFEREQEAMKVKGSDERDMADTKRNHNLDEIQKSKRKNNVGAQQNKYRENRIDKVEKEKDDFSFNNEAIARQGDTHRMDNNYRIENQKSKITNREILSEDIRQERVIKIQSDKKEHSRSERDIREAAQSRQDATELNIEEEKKKLAKAGESTKKIQISNAAEIERKKQAIETASKQVNLSSQIRRMEDLEKRKEQTSGSPTDERNYRVTSGSEDIPQGITETSYKIGTNKDVIERTVRIGNKIDVYRKVISKYGTAYFKNDHSITQQTWDRETVRVTD